MAVGQAAQAGILMPNTKCAGAADLVGKARALTWGAAGRPRWFTRKREKQLGAPPAVVRQSAAPLVREG
jgi:hypothetical protein